MSLSNIDNEDFLALTRTNEHHLNPFSFVLQNGTQVEVWDTGVIVFIPRCSSESGKHIVLSCGIHGNETAPIELLNDLIQQLLRQNIVPVNWVLFIIGNPAAINKGSRFVEENLNRLFSGNYAVGNINNKERERAGKLERYIARFYDEEGQLGKEERYHYDLHTAIRGSKYEKFAIYPYLHNKPWSKKQLKLLRACGISAILLYDQPTTTFSYFSSHHFNAHAFTIELGKVKPFGQNTASDFSEMRATLYDLITDAYSDENDKQALNELLTFKTLKTVTRTQARFHFTFSNEIENFTPFRKGEVLGYDGNTPFVAEVDGEAIVFPNDKVALGQRALLTVQPYTLTKKDLC